MSSFIVKPFLLEMRVIAHLNITMINILNKGDDTFSNISNNKYKPAIFYHVSQKNMISRWFFK